MDDGTPHGAVRGLADEQMTALRIEPATIDHVELLWSWATDPVVRANSFNTATIPWDEHCRWFTRKISSPDCRIWILYEDARPVAQVRYDRTSPHSAEISFSVAEGCRGKGFGTAVLRLTAPLAARELKVTELVGFVKTGNEASIRAFTRAEYTKTGPVVVKGVECLRFALRLPGDGEGADP